MKEIHAAFNEGSVDVILRTRVSLLKLFLGSQARCTERWVHQYHVEARAQQIYECDSVRRIAGEKPSTNVHAACGSFSEVSQYFHDARLGLMEDAVVINA